MTYLTEGIMPLQMVQRVSKAVVQQGVRSCASHFISSSPHLQLCVARSVQNGHVFVQRPIQFHWRRVFCLSMYWSIGVSRQRSMRYSLEFSRASKHREFDGDSSLKRPGAGITKHNMYSNRMQIFNFLLRATVVRPPKPRRRLHRYYAIFKLCRYTVVRCLRATDTCNDCHKCSYGKLDWPLKSLTLANVGKNTFIILKMNFHNAFLFTLLQ